MVNPPSHYPFYFSNALKSLTTFIFVKKKKSTIIITAEAQGGYDFIVVDPPWPNKSGKNPKLLWNRTGWPDFVSHEIAFLSLIAHRSSQYTTLDIYALFEIPLPKLMATESIVAVWVTNRPKYKRFLIDKLFPAWDLELLGEWYWLKMTTAGDPVMPLNSTHRKPYELLLVAKRKSGSGSNIPPKQLFASLPSRSHSRKPPLNGKNPQLFVTSACTENLFRGWHYVAQISLPNICPPIRVAWKCLLDAWPQTTQAGETSVYYSNMSHFSLMFRMKQLQPRSRRLLRFDGVFFSYMHIPFSYALFLSIC